MSPLEDMDELCRFSDAIGTEVMTQARWLAADKRSKLRRATRLVETAGFTAEEAGLIVEQAAAIIRSYDERPFQEI